MATNGDDSHAARIAAQLSLADQDDAQDLPDDEVHQRVSQAVQQAEDLEDELGLPRTGNPMDVTCHACPRHLSPVTGIGASGRDERVGVCPNCRLDGRGSTAVVTIDGDEDITDRTQKRLEQRQRKAQAQSVSSAAAFLDRDVPAGQYEVRRVEPHTVVIYLPDDIDQDARRDLSDRLQDVTKASGNRVWYVHSFPDRVRLLDATFGPDPEPAADVYAGP